MPASEATMAKRSRHAVSGCHEGIRERPATGYGHPRAARHRRAGIRRLKTCGHFPAAAPSGAEERLGYGRHSTPRIETSSSGPFGWHQVSTASSSAFTPASIGADREAAMQAAMASSP